MFQASSIKDRRRFRANGIKRPRVGGLRGQLAPNLKHVPVISLEDIAVLGYFVSLHQLPEHLPFFSDGKGRGRI
jgi:hypothetical protein